MDTEHAKKKKIKGEKGYRASTKTTKKKTILEKEKKRENWKRTSIK